MGSFRFWQRWLTLSCFVFGSVEIAVALFDDSPRCSRWNAGFREVFAGGAKLTPEKPHYDGSRCSKRREPHIRTQGGKTSHERLASPNLIQVSRKLVVSTLGSPSRISPP